VNKERMMMDGKTLAGHLSKRKDHDRATQRELAARLDDGGPVGAGAERVPTIIKTRPKRAVGA